MVVCVQRALHLEVYDHEGDGEHSEHAPPRVTHAT